MLTNSPYEEPQFRLTGCSFCMAKILQPRSQRQGFHNSLAFCSLRLTNICNLKPEVETRFINLTIRRTTLETRLMASWWGFLKVDSESWCKELSLDDFGYIRNYKSDDAKKHGGSYQHPVAPRNRLIGDLANCE